MAKEILEKSREQYKSALTREDMHRALSMEFLKPKNLENFKEKEKKLKVRQNKR